MASPTPIQVPSDFSNLKTLSDLIRFVSSFAGQVAGSINAILSTKIAYGCIGLSGTVAEGSSNFGCSLFSTGTYYFAFRQSYTSRPAVAFGCETLGLIRGASITTAGFFAVATTTAGVAANLPFSFIANGGR